jgi:hypothetical protein
MILYHMYKLLHAMNWLQVKNTLLYRLGQLVIQIRIQNASECIAVMKRLEISNSKLTI